MRYSFVSVLAQLNMVAAMAETRELGTPERSRTSQLIIRLVVHLQQSLKA